MSESTEFTPFFFHRVLLTVDEDDSTSTQRAFRYAVTVARDYQAHLGVCSVIESQDINIYDSLTPSKVQEKRDAVQAVVDRYAAAAKEAGIKDVTGFVGEGGDVDDTIIDQIIPDFQPDLIVCGADTEFASHRNPGTVSVQLAKKAPVSVIVVR